MALPVTRRIRIDDHGPGHGQDVYLPETARQSRVPLMTSWAAEALRPARHRPATWRRRSGTPATHRALMAFWEGGWSPCGALSRATFGVRESDRGARASSRRQHQVGPSTPIGPWVLIAREPLETRSVELGEIAVIIPLPQASARPLDHGGCEQQAGGEQRRGDRG
jgi:hypothetical protein